MIVLVAGVTGVGKTKATHTIARNNNIPAVCGDSLQLAWGYPACCGSRDGEKFRVQRLLYEMRDPSLPLVSPKEYCKMALDAIGKKSAVIEICNWYLIEWLSVRPNDLVLGIEPQLSSNLWLSGYARAVKALFNGMQREIRYGVKGELRDNLLAVSSFSGKGGFIKRCNIAMNTYIWNDASRKYCELKQLPIEWVKDWITCVRRADALFNQEGFSQ